MIVKQKNLVMGLMGIGFTLSIIWACSEQSPAVMERRTSPLGSNSEESADAGDAGEQQAQTPAEGDEQGAEDAATSFTLQWQHNDPSVYEYEVYAGPSRDALTLVDTFRNIEDVAEAEFLNKPVFSIEAPAVKISAADFGYQAGGDFCTQIVAVNVHGKSQPSVSCLKD